jgi:Ankyrin repeats (3 copies)
MWHVFSTCCSSSYDDIISVNDTAAQMNFSNDFSFDDKPKNSPNVIALFNAASRNQLEKLNDIICKNASVQVTEDVNGFNCFHIAAKKGHIEIVKRIHNLYPDIVNTRTSDNQRSSLMLSAFEGHDNVVQYLSKFEVLSYFSDSLIFTVHIDNLMCTDIDCSALNSVIIL